MHGYAPMIDPQSEHELRTAALAAQQGQSAPLGEALPSKQAYDLHRSMVEQLKDYTESVSGPLPGRKAVREMVRPGDAVQLARMIGM